MKSRFPAISTRSLFIYLIHFYFVLFSSFFFISTSAFRNKSNIFFTATSSWHFHLHQRHGDMYFLEGDLCVRDLFVCLWRVYVCVHACKHALFSYKGTRITSTINTTMRTSNTIIITIISLSKWRFSWCNVYRPRKWTRRHGFKSWTRLIAFQIALISLGKVWIQLFSLQLWVNSRTDCVLQPCWGN